MLPNRLVIGMLDNPSLNNVNKVNKIIGDNHLVNCASSTKPLNLSILFDNICLNNTWYLLFDVLKTYSFNYDDMKTDIICDLTESQTITE